MSQKFRFVVTVEVEDEESSLQVEMFLRRLREGDSYLLPISVEVARDFETKET